MKTLPKSKFDDFKRFLDSRGTAHRPGKGPTQVLQVMTISSGWRCIYKRKDMPDHYKPDVLLESTLIGFFSEFERPQKPVLPGVNYIIVFEDQDRENEFFIDLETSVDRLDILRDNWNCHLFKRIKSV